MPPMKLDKLPFEVFQIIKKHGLLRPNATVIVGVSGGPDSVALLRVLFMLNKPKNLRLRLCVAHLNHQLRGMSSDEDERFVQNLAKGLSLPFLLKRSDVQAVAEQSRLSIEEAARAERYKFFAESARGHNASFIAVGHNADDQAETLLHRIIRGTGVLGLGGIPVKRPLSKDVPALLVRPLLFSWRKDILEYLGRERQDYRTDATNFETLYLRNKIRLELIPFLESRFNPNVKSALVQLGQILNANNEYVVQKAKELLKEVTVGYDKDSYTINTRPFINQPEILQHLVFREILGEMQIPLREITYGHYAKITDEIAVSGRGRHFQLPGGLSLWHEHGKLCFRRGGARAPSIPITETVLKIPGTTPLASLGVLVSEVVDAGDFSLDEYKKTKTRGEEAFDLERMVLPLLVRGRRDGDTISPLGIKGHKKLKDIFIDKKIPVEERAAVPVVVMNGRPVWVVGVCMDNDVKVTYATKKVLKLCFRRAARE